LRPFSSTSSGDGTDPHGHLPWHGGAGARAAANRQALRLGRTLIKILSGYHRQSEGEIRINRERVEIGGPQQAFALGISTIYQEPNLCPHLSIAENVKLGRMHGGGWGIDKARMERDVASFLADIGLDVAPGTLVSQLSPGQRQLVQIARALSLNAQILILDEPTAALTATESATLFSILRRLKARGITILYISHRMPEILANSDDVTVLRDGRHVHTAPIDTLNEDEIVRLMVGEQKARIEHRSASAASNPILATRALSGAGFSDVSLQLRPGEILGMFGLVGSGRTELALTLFGARPARSGSIVYDGVPYAPRHPADALRRGIALVPEDRKHNGVLLGRSIAENISLPHLSRLSVMGWVSNRVVDRFCGELFRRLSIKASGLYVPARSLSGGNQQKVALAKSIARRCRLLMVDEPTQGVDVAGKEEIYRILDELAAEGAAILMITSDIVELLRMSDRIAVLAEGRLSGELDAPSATEEVVMQLAAGRQSRRAA
jgi:ABC-type sugar transport system ATPase subunit